jgi:phosphatidate cytidylyltransferase
VLRQRILTAVVALFVVAAALFVMPQWATRLLIAVLMLLAAWEWSGLLAMQGRNQRIAFVGLVAVLAILVFFFRPVRFSDESFFFIAAVWWAMAFVWLLMHPTPIPRVAGWLCGTLVIVPAWYAIDWLYLDGNGSLPVVLLVVLGADTGAFFAGKLFGRVKLAPSISPGKTWEGVIGGMLIVLLVAVAVSLQTGGSLLVYLSLFLATAAVSIVGDLTVSVFKRRAGVKDSGTLFPGHGGVLDRIDSICAAAPVYAMALAAGVMP